MDGKISMHQIRPAVAIRASGHQGEESRGEGGGYEDTSRYLTDDRLHVLPNKIPASSELFTRRMSLHAANGELDHQESHTRGGGGGIKLLWCISQATTPRRQTNRTTGK